MLFAKYYIESLGLVADVSPDIFSDAEEIYSNTDEFRTNDLVSALLDDKVKVIWCIRGGSGCVRMIPHLEKTLPATINHKIFIGYSDATALHIYFQYKYGMQSIHVCMIQDITFNHPDISLLQGLMLQDIATNFYPPLSESVLTTLDLIFERRDKICLPATKLNNINVTTIESKVVGGNSAMSEISIGTIWEIRPKGRIFFLEDIGDLAHHIEKRLDHMKQARTFDGVDAVVFGDFSETDSQELVDFVLDRFAQSVNFPVFRVTNMGHDEVNLPLPLLTYCKINSDDGGVTYEFCVDNIQSTSSTGNGSDSSSSSVYPVSEISFLALTVFVVIFMNVFLLN